MNNLISARKLISILLVSIAFLIAYSGVAAADTWRQDLETYLNTTSGEEADVIIRFKKIDMASLQNIKGKERSDKVTRHSDLSQEFVIKELENGKKQKKVKKYERFRHMNEIRVVADKETIRALAERSDIESIIENAVIRLAPEPMGVITAPSDQAWHVKKIGKDNVAENGNGIIAVVVDTGVDAFHPDLAGKFSGLWKDCAETSSTPVDASSHGTHVAGIITHDTYGIAPGANFAAIRIFDSSGNSTFSNVTCALDQIADWKLGTTSGSPETNIVVANHSWGESTQKCSYIGNSSALWADMENLQDITVDVMQVVSAGNCGPTASSIPDPGSYPFVFTVGSTTESDAIANSSSRGPVIWSGTSYVKPDVSAPGEPVYSTIPGNSYGWKAGTSMAAPVVTGAVAVLQEISLTNSGSYLSIGTVKTYLESTAVDLGLYGKDNAYGSGRVNLFEAASLLNPAGGGGGGSVPNTFTCSVSETGSGHPIQATVYVIDLLGNIAAHTASDSSGNCASIFLPDGSYKLNVVAIGYAPIFGGHPFAVDSSNASHSEAITMTVQLPEDIPCDWNTQNSPAAGEETNLMAYISNLGKMPFADYDFHVQIWTGATIPPSGSPSGTNILDDYLDALAPNNNGKLLLKQFVFPAAGEYTIHVFADNSDYLALGNNVPEEEDLINNSYYGTICAHIPTPDLAVTHISTPYLDACSPTEGDVMTVTVNITNQGEIDINTTAPVILNVDGACMEDASGNCVVNDVAPIAKGETKTVTINWSTSLQSSPSSPQVRRLTAVADPDDIITEKSETNNQLSRNVKIYPMEPDLYADYIEILKPKHCMTAELDAAKARVRVRNINGKNGIAAPGASVSFDIPGSSTPAQMTLPKEIEACGYEWFETPVSFTYATPGTKTVTATAGDSSITEVLTNNTIKTNVCVADRNSFNLYSTSPPDIYFLGDDGLPIDPPWKIDAGDTVHIYGVVNNEGPAAAPEGIQITLEDRTGEGTYTFSSLLSPQGFELPVGEEFPSPWTQTGATYSPDPFEYGPSSPVDQSGTTPQNISHNTTLSSSLGEPDGEPHVIILRSYHPNELWTDDNKTNRFLWVGDFNQDICVDFNAPELNSIAIMGVPSNVSIRVRKKEGTECLPDPVYPFSFETLVMAVDGSVSDTIDVLDLFNSGMALYDDDTQTFSFYWAPGSSGGTLSPGTVVTTAENPVISSSSGSPSSISAHSGTPPSFENVTLTAIASLSGDAGNGTGETTIRIAEYSLECVADPGLELLANNSDEATISCVLMKPTDEGMEPVSGHLLKFSYEGDAEIRLEAVNPSDTTLLTATTDLEGKVSAILGATNAPGSVTVFVEDLNQAFPYRVKASLDFTISPAFICNLPNLPDAPTTTEACEWPAGSVWNVTTDMKCVMDASHTINDVDITVDGGAEFILDGSYSSSDSVLTITVTNGNVEISGVEVKGIAKVSNESQATFKDVVFSSGLYGYASPRISVKDSTFNAGAGAGTAVGASVIGTSGDTNITFENTLFNRIGGVPFSVYSNNTVAYHKNCVFSGMSNLQILSSSDVTFDSSSSVLSNYSLRIGSNNVAKQDAKLCVINNSEGFNVVLMDILDSNIRVSVQNSYLGNFHYVTSKDIHSNPANKEFVVSGFHPASYPDKFNGELYSRDLNDNRSTVSFTNSSLGDGANSPLNIALIDTSIARVDDSTFGIVQLSESASAYINDSISLNGSFSTNVSWNGEMELNNVTRANNAYQSILRGSGSIRASNILYDAIHQGPYQLSGPDLNVDTFECSVCSFIFNSLSSATAYMNNSSFWALYLTNSYDFSTQNTPTINSNDSFVHLNNSLVLNVASGNEVSLNGPLYSNLSSPVNKTNFNGTLLRKFPTIVNPDNNGVASGIMMKAWDGDQFRGTESVSDENGIAMPSFEYISANANETFNICDVPDHLICDARNVGIVYDSQIIANDYSSSIVIKAPGESSLISDPTPIISGTSGMNGSVAIYLKENIVEPQSPSQTQDERPVTLFDAPAITVVEYDRLKSSRPEPMFEMSYAPMTFHGRNYEGNGSHETYLVDFAERMFIVTPESGSLLSSDGVRPSMSFAEPLNLSLIWDEINQTGMTVYTPLSLKEMLNWISGFNNEATLDLFVSNALTVNSESLQYEFNEVFSDEMPFSSNEERITTMYPGVESGYYSFDSSEDGDHSSLIYVRDWIDAITKYRNALLSINEDAEPIATASVMDGGFEGRTIDLGYDGVKTIYAVVTNSETGEREVSESITFNFKRSMAGISVFSYPEPMRSDVGAVFYMNVAGGEPCDVKISPVDALWTTKVLPKENAALISRNEETGYSSYSIQWDGKDENGRRVNPGSYVAELRCEGENVNSVTEVTVIY